MTLIMKKYIQAVLLTALCIFINLFGKRLAEMASLPVWLDSFGTCLAAYVLGPVSGASVGIAGNLIYGIHSSISYVYCLVSFLIGLLVGILTRRHKMDTLFGTLSVSVAVTGVSVIISAPLNYMFFDGLTGNLWGDSIIEYLRLLGLPDLFCSITGEFYIDFLDKVLTLTALYCIIRIRVALGMKTHTRPESDVSKEDTDPGVKFLALPFLLVLALAPGMQVRAEEAANFYSYVQTVYSSAEGLLGGEANDIAQTRDGVLWVGTYAGLFRYNGTEFRAMSDFSSVRNVNCLYVDEEGRLWVGTNDNGLTLIISEDVSNVLDTKSGLPSNSVRCIVQGSDGCYYVGTSDTLQILSLSGGLQMLSNVPEIVYAHSIDADRRGQVAAVTNAGKLFILRDKQVVFEDSCSEEGVIYTCCSFDKRGNLYVGTSSGKVIRFDVEEDGLKQGRVYSCGDLSKINSLTFTDERQLFVCADNGVGCFQGGMIFSTIHLGQFNNSIDSVLVDYQGNYWFTSSRLGLLRLSRSAVTDIYGEYAMEQKVVNTVAGFDGRLYIGTDKGLDIVDEGKGYAISDDLTELFSGLRIRDLFADSRGGLWVSSYGRGLMEVRREGERVEERLETNPEEGEEAPEEEEAVAQLRGYTITRHDSTTDFCDWVRVAAELEDGTIVSAGDAGIGFIKDGSVQHILPYGEELTAAMILCLLPEGEEILAGSDGDGIVVIRDGKVTERFTAENGLSSGVVLRIVKASDGGGYYIVTSNGLCYMDKARNIRILEHFPYSNNFDIWTGDKGRLFILSSAGVFIGEEQELIKDEEDTEYELLDVKRGLKASLTPNSWNYMDEQGRLFLSADSGVYMLKTDDYGRASISYRMTLKTAYLDNVLYRVERGMPIEISRDNTKIELFPEVLNYTLETPLISYYLEGVDTQETVLPAASLSSIVYTNLPSGDYALHLALLDSDRNVLEQSSYILSKEMELYDHWYFRLYMVLVAGLAVVWLTWLLARIRLQRTLALREQELRLARQQVQMGNETIMAVARTMDAKDGSTSQHSQRVSDYSVMIARELGWSEEECENIRKAALLHDIGKIGIPDRILNKPSGLTDEEYAIMKTHVTRGAEILKDFTMVEHVVEGALYHHERYDGSGYMMGLKGEEIPIYGRIIGVADTFDAMTQNRVYRKGLNMEVVLDEIQRCEGTQFDPEIAEIMVKLVREGKIVIGGKKEANEEV